MLLRADQELPHANGARFGALLVLGLVLVLLGLTGTAPRSLAGAAAPVAGAAARAPAAPAGPPRRTPARLTAVGPITPTGQIAFSRNATIYTMYADGSNQHFIGAMLNDLAYQPAWSPDGKKLVFTNDFGFARTHRSPPTPRQLLARRLINPSPWLRLGPAGGSDYNLWVINADGSNETQLSNGFEDINPVFSPDGTKIAFASTRTAGIGAAQIYVMNSDGNNAHALSTGTTNLDMEPAWSPDGTQIAFTSYRGTDFDIYLMPATGGAGKNITNNRAMYDIQPSWSPTGTQILFASNRDNGTTAQVYLMNADGSGQTRLLTDPGVPDDVPVWSPDGTLIAYQHGAAPGTEIYEMLTDGSNATNITSNGGADIEPAWLSGPVVLVKNEASNVVPNAEVYDNCVLLGTTNSHGVLPLLNPQNGEELIARTLIYTGTTMKGDHDNWAYHVWLTSVNQNDDGSQTSFVITDATQITQTVVVTRTNAQIGLNLVASVEYNATQANLQDIAGGLNHASDYLFDVTDGQMFIEKLTLYEDKQHWNDADIQFKPWIWPQADTGTFLQGAGHLYMPGPGFNGHVYQGPWTQPDAFRTFIHEFGHYAFGAYDEYKSSLGRSACTLVPDRTNEPDASAASIMDYQYSTSEMCDSFILDLHNPNTDQGEINGQPVWETFAQNWNDPLNRWHLVTPADRGAVDPGPNLVTCMDTISTTIVPVAAAACDPTRLTVTLLGGPVTGAYVTLTHNGNALYEGLTDNNGQLLLYGAAVGDRVQAVSVGFPRVMLAASKVLTDCNPTQLPLEQPAAPAASWPSGWLTGTPDFTARRLNLALHFAAAPPAPPTMSANQDGQGPQTVSLTYDPASFTYSGVYTFDPARTLDFQVNVGLPGAQGARQFTYNLVAVQYHAAGPERGTISRAPVPPPPAAWDLFRPENLTGVVVHTGALPDGTGVLVGDSGLPDVPPANLVAVGGPYSVQGQVAPSLPVTMTLEYQAEYFCGLQAGSAAVYRYGAGGWTALPTTLDGNWHQAAAATNQWGIFAVFARPNPAAVFSDVLTTNPFYTYVEFMACRGIISGYTDGTFRPYANTTRGQFSKMVALGLRWNLELPATRTFADVPAGSPFALYVEAAYRMGVISGYACGGPGEPCDPQQRPYFRPYATITRSQIAKILVLAANYAINTSGGPHFADVPTTNPFYRSVETMYGQGIISGYTCGGPGEPCDAQHRPYFRPGNPATRGQISKMVYLVLAPR